MFSLYQENFAKWAITQELMSWEIFRACLCGQLLGRWGECKRGMSECGYGLLDYGRSFDGWFEPVSRSLLHFIHWCSVANRSLLFVNSAAQVINNANFARWSARLHHLPDWNRLNSNIPFTALCALFACDSHAGVASWRRLQGEMLYFRLSYLRAIWQQLHCSFVLIVFKLETVLAER